MYKTFPNIGFIEKKLNKETIKILKSYVKNKKGSFNYSLAGNINGSFTIKDKNNWFYNNIIMPTVIEYEKNNSDFFLTIVPQVLTKNCAFVLDSFWVNFQKKHEFNPVHSHSGVFSFVIWLDIPVNFKKESKLNFVNHSNAPKASCFEFVYTTTIGQIDSYVYELSSDYNGTMLFFPSKLNHVVYPFYTSNKNRISISGNIALDPQKIINKKNVL